MRDKLNASRRQQFESIDLKSKVGDVCRKRKFKEKPWPEMIIRQERLGISGVYKDRPENKTADPHDRATKIERAGLHHGDFRLRNSIVTRAAHFSRPASLALLAAKKLIEELLQNVPAHHTGVRERLPVRVKNRRGSLIHAVRIVAKRL